MNFLKALVGIYIQPNIQIAKHALGKYIIGFACALHLLWALLLAIDIRAANATPVSILFVLLGNSRLLVIFTLLVVAMLAGGFLDMRLRKQFNLSALSMLLVPQQTVLLCSAGAGIFAACAGHYADGVTKSWAHILADQLPVILMAFLYTVALLETRHPPLKMFPAKGAKGDKGDKGAPGPPGERGPRGFSSNA